MGIDPFVGRRTAAALACAALLGAAALVADKAAAADYPERPVTIVVPFPGGGSADALPRIVGEQLRVRLKQPFIIENRPGAAGTLGTEAVSRAQPDGYTLLATPNAPIVINQFTQSALRYDPSRMTPISMLATATLVMAVPPGLPVKTVGEFIAYAKANPGKINYGSQGPGGLGHLSGINFAKSAGIEMVHVPFRGSALALNALMAGTVQVFFDNIGSTLELHKAGKIRILAVGSTTRHPDLPDIPTLQEAGLKDLVLTTWFGLLGPPDLPASMVELLNREVNDILKMPETVTLVRRLGLEPAGGTAASMRTFLTEDRARWETLIREAKITPQ